MNENQIKSHEISHIWQVDLFKGIAMLMVIFCHSAQRFSLPRWGGILPAFSQMGCQIFIVMSAFTLYLSIRRRNESYIRYMHRRIKRILPEYYLAIMIYVIACLMSIVLLKTNRIGNDVSIVSVLVNLLLLHGFVPTTANNRVVRGGWFVGTLVILYALTPFLFRIYENTNGRWRKVRRYAFPVIIFMFASISVLGIEYLMPGMKCINNSFMYFSFLNQLTCYSLGFVLGDLYTNRWKRNTQKTLWIGAMSIVASFVLFFVNIGKVFVVIPTIFGVGTLFLFVYICDIVPKQSKICSVTCRIGRESLAIYLTHAFIVYEGSFVVRNLVKKFPIYISEFVLWLIWLPIAVIISYYVGAIFQKTVRKIKCFIMYRFVNYWS